MSRTPITADDPHLGHLAGSYILEGEDRVRVHAVYDSVEDIATRTKSLRLPVPMIDAIEAIGHPDGFSGIVREALVEWFDRHGTATAEADDARRALATLHRVITRHLTQHPAA